VYICSWTYSTYWDRAFPKSRLRDHIHLDKTHSVGLLWPSDVETSTWQQAALRKDRHPCSQRDSKPQSRQIHVLDRAATGRGSNISIYVCVCVCVSTARLIHEFCVILQINNDYFIKKINQLFFTFETKYLLSAT